VLKTIGRPRVEDRNEVRTRAIVAIVLGIPFRYLLLFLPPPPPPLLLLLLLLLLDLLARSHARYRLSSRCGGRRLSFRRKTRVKLEASRRIPGCEKKRESARARETRVSWYPRDGRSNVLGRPTAQKRRRQQDERARTNDVIVQLTTAG